MRRGEFSELVGFRVGTRKLFERVVVHNEEISENNVSFFFYTRKIRESKFRFSEKEILECFVNLNLIVKLGDKVKNGNPLYASTESKLQACKLVGTRCPLVIPPPKPSGEVEKMTIFSLSLNFFTFT